jgi:formylglycine-generating enzyme required for sulfatase activity
MVLIHGGTMQIGIRAADIPRFQKIFSIENERLFQDEIPRHTITVKAFYIDKNLVTNAQFKPFVDAHPSWRPNGSFSKSTRFDNGNYLRHWQAPNSENAKPDRPVVNVSWYAAIGYCRWAGKRLPTEAEWEFAARGGQEALFPWGDQLPDETRANFNNNVGTTTPVGSYPANPYGLFDMAGDVWQFLYDRWAPYGATSAETQKPQGSTFDPPIPLPEPRHVIRGGSYAGAPINLWVEYRDSHPASGSEPFVGFRCAKSASN